MAEQREGPLKPAAEGGEHGRSRPDEREFLTAVLAELEDAPAELRERMVGLIDSDDRATEIRDLFEELTK